MTSIGGREGNAEVVNQFVFQEMRGSKYFCIDKVSYKDRDGINVDFDLDAFFLISLSERHRSMHQALDKLCMENIDLPVITCTPEQ